jgi:hypothetical protein
MATSINKIEIFTLEDESSDKNIEFTSSSQSEGVHIEMYPVSGGDDELKADLTLQDGIALIRWLMNALSISPEDLR